jgi:hypothetical protein
MKNYAAVILYSTVQSSNKSNVDTIWIKNIHTDITDMITMIWPTTLISDIH